MAELPSGTVTFLFTDIEGSTARWEHQPEAMRAALARHDALVRAAIHEHDGHVVKTMGDAFHAVFVRAPDAVAAALDAQRRLQAEPWGEIGPIRVRMAVHTGAAEERDGDYYGPPLNRAARLMSAGHGGQILLSQSTYELVRDTPPDGVDVRRSRRASSQRSDPPGAGLPARGAGPPVRLPTARLARRPPAQPAAPADAAARARAATSRPCASLLLARRRPARDADRAGRDRQDPPGPPGRGRPARPLRGRRVLRRAGADLRSRRWCSSTIAQALGVARRRRPPDRSTRSSDYLRGRRLLLLLDNFEQVLAAAPVVDATCSRPARA